MGFFDFSSVRERAKRSGALAWALSREADILEADGEIALADELRRGALAIAETRAWRADALI